MTYKMKTTGYEGYPFQADSHIVMPLNTISQTIRNNGLGVDHHVLEGLVKKGFSGCESLWRPSPKTNDSYGWYHGFHLQSQGAHYALLFPWSQDFKNPESTADRSINLYSQQESTDKAFKGVIDALMPAFEQYSTLTPSRGRGLLGPPHIMRWFL